MTLSDEVLADRERMKRVRFSMEGLTREVGARAAFLVDEAGTPFATVGHVEFRLPDPIAGLVEDGGGDAILEALVGEPPDGASNFAVERVTARALLVLVLPCPPDARLRLAVQAGARAIGRALESNLASPGGGF